MQRKSYIIAYGNYRVVKHAWNSAIREIEVIMRRIVQAEGGRYDLTASGGEKDEMSNYVRGFREWTSDTGKVVRFDVWREA